MSMRRRVRVAYCLDSFEVGGTELNAVRTAEALDPGRIELRVFHLQDHGPLRARYERLGVPLVHVPIPNLYSMRTIAQGVRLARRLRHEDVDVVHSHDLYCNIFAVPWARALGGCSTLASRRWGTQQFRPALARVNHWGCLLAHRVLANSSGVAAMLSREGVPRDRIVEVPNFLSRGAFDDADPDERREQRRAWGIPAGAFLVGIVARLAPEKNHAMLLRAMALLEPRFHLVAIGDGPSRAGAEQLARELGIEDRVFFAGEVTAGGNLHRYFDASVLCSLSEGFPNSVIEAMAARRPVVATAVGGVADAVTHDVTGLLVPAGEAAPLAQALRRLEADAALRERLGEAGRAAARARFRQEVVIEQLSALYEALALARGAAAPAPA